MKRLTLRQEEVNEQTWIHFEMSATDFLSACDGPSDWLSREQERARERDTSLGVPVNNLTAAPLGPGGLLCREPELPQFRRA